MNQLYEITMFLDIALLAVVVTVFVLAVSLLGRALEQAASERQHLEEERGEQHRFRGEAIRKRLDEQQDPERMAAIQKELNEHQKQERAFEGTLRRIRQTPYMLSVGGSVVIPAGSFVISLALSAAAMVTNGWIPHVLWGGSLAFLVDGCARVYRCLGVIQRVAVTSEAAQFTKQVAALRSALDEHEAASRPALTLRFREEEPPFFMQPNGEKDIQFGVGLARGDVARNINVVFIAPLGFDFPGHSTLRRGPDRVFPNSIETWVDLSMALRGLQRTSTLHVKASAEAGEYTMYYLLACEGFTGTPEEFKITVLEATT